MSYTVDAASKVHDGQVAAVENFQSMMVKAADGLTGLRRTAPQAPEQLTDVVRKVAAPLTNVVGSPSEVRAYAVARSRDWLKVQHQFQAALHEAVFPSDVTVEVPAPTSSRTRKKS